ncbi:MAG: hypothetical protein KBD56_06050 [Candidatus Eisenbacteria bacterium]|nr:hypothetical protein [Candidatus Eisenbacteria bacterium]
MIRSPIANASPRGFDRPALAAALLILVASAMDLARLARFALLGWDTYPLILTSGGSVSAVFANFTQPLMHGLYPSDFYRPVLNLTFAFDRALWGLSPFGYHLTTIVLFAACAAALWHLLRTLSRGGAPDARGAWIGPLAGLLVFLLHYTHYEVLPVPSRRAEILCGLFLALALATQLRASRAWLPVVFAVLAYLSKETAFVLPALIFVAVLLYAPQRNASERMRHALRACLPHAIALAAVLAIRLAVLGGIGGHKESSLAGALGRLPVYTAGMFKWALFPQEAMQKSPVAPWLLVIACAGIAACAFAAGTAAASAGRARAGTGSKRSSERLAPAAPAMDGRKPGLFAIAWLLAMAGAYSLAAEMSPWYMLLPVMGLAMLCSAIAQLAVQGASADERIPAARGWRAAAVIGAVPLAALLLWQASYSPLVRAYPEWSDASRVAREFLEVTHEQIAEAPEGALLEGGPMPTWVRPRAGATAHPRVYGAAIFAEYSVQAWAQLVFPSRAIAVKVAPTLSHAKAPPDGVLLVFTKNLPGY